MELQVKLLSDKAVLPYKAHDTDAGYDLTAISLDVKTQDKVDYLEYGTGIAVDIPEGYVGLIFPRSSISRTNLTLCNSVGVIDAGYQGEIKFRFKIDLPYDELYYEEGSFIIKDREESFSVEAYKVGDRIGQLVVMPLTPITSLKVTQEFTPSLRGQKGFGSSGN